jgi:hypothetical protein
VQCERRESPRLEFEEGVEGEEEVDQAEANGATESVACMGSSENNVSGFGQASSRGHAIEQGRQ